MTFFESFKQAIISLTNNKLRSLLTMLGIIMGVFSVITIIAVSNATEGYISSQFEKLGASVVIFMVKSDTPQEFFFTLDDFDRIRKIAPEVKYISAQSMGFGTIKIRNESKDSYLIGATPQLRFVSTEGDLLHGRYVNDFDIQSKASVVVVEERFANRYFGRTDIIGEVLDFDIYGNSARLKVVGVLESEEGLMGAMMDSDLYPPTMIIPMTLCIDLTYSSGYFSELYVSISDRDRTSEVTARVIKMLEMQRGREEIFTAQNSMEAQSEINSITSVISLVLLVIAIITLVVGGIGIINIMLVSVTERIREIGIRKALGATKMDIVSQFITESMLLTGIGGLIGIGMGVGGASIISALIKIPPVVNVNVMVMSLVGSMILGLLFGVYPAKKAADLDPIESLRFE